MPEDRIAKLSQRFGRHAVGRPPGVTRARERRSYYLATELADRVDQVYREINHGLYPRSVSKSVFLETVLEFGLDHLDEITGLLAQAAEADSAAESP